MSADQGVYCESCGAYVELRDGGPVHICPGCRVVSCQRCWDPAHGRCPACTSTLIASGLPARPLRGLAAARWILGELAGLRADAEALSSASTDWSQGEGSDVHLDLLLLGAWAKTLRADADLAVATASPRSAIRIAEVVRQLDAEAAAIELALAEIRVDRNRQRVEEDVAPRGSAAEWLAAYRSQLIRIGAGVAAVIILAVVAPLIPALSSSLNPTEPTAPAASERAGVLGGDPQTPTPVESDGSEVPAQTLITFDEWRMTAAIPPEWRIERGSGEQVGVVGYPSAVDRSVELRASPTGIGVTLCRALPAAARSLHVDVLTATSTAGLQLAMPSDVRRSMRPSWLLTADASGRGSSATTVPLMVDGWYRFEAEMDPSGAVLRWRVLDPGRETADATVIAHGDVALANAPSDVCLTIRDGVSDRRVLIDNLMIGQSG